MTTTIKEFTLVNEDDTKGFAEKLAQLPMTGSVWLSGDLGVGKTTLTRYWLTALGHIGKVKSPTYTLVEPYKLQTAQGSKPVYHCDLYRLQDAEELDYIGFNEYIEEDNSLVIIEWASRALDYLPEPVIKVELTTQADESRLVSISLKPELASSELQQAFANIQF